MSRSSFGQPPQPQLGMSGPKGLPGPMSSPKAGPGMAPPQMPPQGGPPPMAPPQSPMGGMRAPSMFRRPRY